MPLVSVIVPIYKVEAWLDRCLNSLARQTHANFEALLVDDGSPDGCGAICDRRAAQDARFIVIHKQNGGISSARNAGLDAMKGDFFLFVDPDDDILPEHLENLVRAQARRDADIAVGRYVWILAKTGRALRRAPARGDVFIERKDLLSFLPALLEERRLMYVMYKLYRTETFGHLRFIEGMRINEDTCWVMQALRLVRTIQLADHEGYLYMRYATGTLTKQAGRDLFGDHLRAYQAMIDTFRACDWMTPATQSFADDMLYRYIVSSILAIGRGAWPTREKALYVEKLLREPAVTQCLDRVGDRKSDRTARLLRRGDGLAALKCIVRRERKRVILQLLPGWVARLGVSLKNGLRAVKGALS